MRFFVFIFILFAAKGFAQVKVDSVVNSTNNDSSAFQILMQKFPNGKVMQMLVIDGDTNYLYNLPTVRIVGEKLYGDAEKDKQFRRLRYHVTKVYPYAKLASKKLKEYNEELINVGSNRKRRLLLKQREQELKEEFTDVIKTMTVTQGRVLVKLIDRETGESTYDIIKEMRGGFKAFIYQGIAKFYDGNLKERYNPKENEEDEMIERIVLMIEEGKL
ncbi:MAG: DUF4294 domain-containing protein [Flavobacteriales bacterium]|nr:DUF4294 domain-containing protein [Flavobacteriales bacterium]MCL4857550.1 DUF4294 domain-containing protein [Flavobacteriales bacterium]